MKKFILMLLITISLFAKDSYIVAKGNINFLSDEQILVNNKSFKIDLSTEIENASSNKISLADLKLGDLVEVKGLIENSELIAKKIELEASKSDEQSNNSNLTKIKKNLKVISGIDTKASGKIDYRFKNTKKVEQRLVIDVKIPLNNNTPVLTKISEAKNLVISSNIYRGSEIVAVCVLKYDREPKRIKYAEYKLDLERNNNKIKKNKGICTDLSAKSIVPELLKGDKIVINETLSGSFLEKNL